MELMMVHPLSQAINSDGENKILCMWGAYTTKNSHMSWTQRVLRNKVFLNDTKVTFCQGFHHLGGRSTIGDRKSVHVTSNVENIKSMLKRRTIGDITSFSQYLVL